MKWFFLLFLRGISVGGPYDTQQNCLDALKSAYEQPIIDPGFDHAIPSGLCFQAIRPIETTDK
jgi:hypothetical protein